MDHATLVDQDLALVEEALQQAIATDVDTLGAIGQHVASTPGKRLRPRVLLLSYRAGGGQDGAAAVPLAAAVELVHTASLIHDDVNDQSDLRRGRETVNARWGDTLALLAGDFVFARILSLVGGMGRGIIDLLAETCRTLVEGETLQAQAAGRTDVTEEAYLDIIRRKTAALFATSAQLGGTLAGGADPWIAGLREFGLCVGLAYQIRDDTLDLIGDREALGKPIASDVKQGHVSLAPIYWLARHPQAEAVWASRDPSRIAAALCDSGAIDYAHQTAREYTERGLAALAVLPNSPARAALADLAEMAGAWPA